MSHSSDAKALLTQAANETTNILGYISEAEVRIEEIKTFITLAIEGHPDHDPLHGISAAVLESLEHAMQGVGALAQELSATAQRL